MKEKKKKKEKDKGRKWEKGGWKREAIRKIGRKIGVCKSIISGCESIISRMRIYYFQNANLFGSEP